ncbi:MAG: M48 family peptidase [Burkholderiaceae bacterium]|nr:M48 family peptidase [Burkholderiaceae bacterium]
MIERMSWPRPPALHRLLAAGLVIILVASLAWSDLPSAFAQQRGRGVDNLPALGEASVDELSPAAEQRLGDQIYQELLRVGAVHDDPETLDILDRQARRLLLASQQLGHSSEDRPFRFFLVKDPTINAFAMPGGYIGIHTGLITASEAESEVMSVLAHEIGHVTQRHIARMFGQQRQGSGVMIAAAVLAALAARASPDAAMGMLSLGQTVALREQLAFSRDAEREADRVGLQILAESGFDPKGMSSMFERLSQAGRLYDNNAPSYLRTHPLTTERIADVQSRLQNEPGLGRGAILGNTLEFDWLRAKLQASADTRVDGLRNARQRFLTQMRENKFSSVQPQSSIQFGLAWISLQQRDFAGALDHHRQAARLIKGHPQEAAATALLDHLQLQIQLASAPSPEQKRELDRLAAELAAGHSNSRALMRSVVTAKLSTNSNPDETATMARALTQQWPWDPQTWALLARAEGARSRRTAQHAAVAEQYALVGATAAAIEQLTLARTAADADFVMLSKIDARLTALRAALRREQIERQQSGGRN